MAQELFLLHPHLRQFVTQAGQAHLLIHASIISYVPLSHQLILCGIALKEKQSSIVRNEFVEPNQQTVGEWLRFYVNEIAAINVRLSTYKIHHDNMELHLIPALGRYHLQDPHLRDYIQSFVNSQCRAGYATSSIKRQMAVLKSAFREAQNRQYLLKNPADHIILPKMEQKEIDALSQDEVKLLLPHLPKNTSGRALRFILGTGLRVGELCGLRWEDVGANFIHIKQTTAILTIEGKTQRVTNPPKTKNGKRQIPLNPSLTGILHEQKQVQCQEQMKAGEEWKGGVAGQGEQFVFASMLGTPADRDNLGRCLRSTLKKAGLKSRGLHALRHTFATLWVQRGGDLKTLSEILGHANVAFTMSIYVHSDMETKKKYMDMMGEIL